MLFCGSSYSYLEIYFLSGSRHVKRCLWAYADNECPRSDCADAQSDLGHLMSAYNITGHCQLFRCRLHTLIWLCGCVEWSSTRSKSPFRRPQWLSWMRRPTGDQEVAGSTPVEVGNILSWRLIMKYFLRSFSPFRWFKKGSCQFLAKECAQYWLTA